jgi:hypothetical protein
MAAEIIRYGLSGKLGPPTPGPGETVEEVAEHRRRYEENAAKLAIAGRAHWGRLHTLDHVPTLDEFEEWIKGIPQFGCACEQKFRDRLKTHPFHFTSLAAFHRSGWEAHDAVNEELGKHRVGYLWAVHEWGWAILEERPPGS